MRVSKSALVIALTTAMVLKPMSEAVASPAGDALEADAEYALQMLYDTSPSAAEMGKSAKAVLIFPEVVKIGFMFAGGFGEGVLIKDGKVQGHYNTTSGSYGFQAGAHRYGYAVFLMTDDAVNYLDRSKGWEIGAGPSITMMDVGRAKKISTTTLNTDAYAVIFGQRGLMAGLGIEGSKISLIDC
jgi:lipid-binding SYLF domain-containing protein